jgi:hypothetical protein
VSPSRGRLIPFGRIAGRVAYETCLTRSNFAGLLPLDGTNVSLPLSSESVTVPLFDLEPMPFVQPYQ